MTFEPTHLWKLGNCGTQLYLLIPDVLDQLIFATTELTDLDLEPLNVLMQFFNELDVLDCLNPSTTTLFHILQSSGKWVPFMCDIL